MYFQIVYKSYGFYCTFYIHTYAYISTAAKVLNALLCIYNQMLCVPINYAVVNILYQQRSASAYTRVSSRSAPFKQIN